MRAIGTESAPVKKKTKERVTVATSVTGGGERPEAEKPPERVLMLPEPTDLATPLEGPILDAARMLPGPVEAEEVSEIAPREPLQLTDNGGESNLFTPSPALEAVPVSAT
jgi:hypothetical protein